MKRDNNIGQDKHDLQNKLKSFKSDDNFFIQFLEENSIMVNTFSIIN